MNEEEDYYTKRVRRADETLPHIVWAAVIFFVLYGIDQLFHLIISH
jgi:hypothetical protein